MNAARWVWMFLLLAGGLAEVRAAEITPVSRYAVFYKDVLEFSTTTTMTLNGPVYCNSNIYLGAGSSSTLTFNGTVTARGTISAPDNNGQTWGTNWANWRTMFNGNPAYQTNHQLLFDGDSMSYHYIVEMPTTNDAHTDYGDQRLYNQAQVVLIISNSSISLKLQTSPAPGVVPGADYSPVTAFWTMTNSTIWSSNLPFLSLTNRFYDARESKTNLVTQIDVGRYSVWLTNSSYVLSKFPVWGVNYLTILYVADFRSSNGFYQAAVRLTNGIVPPRNGGFGWTLATPNPLYVWGNYNCPNPAHLGTTNTSATYPCALISDALTLLSSAWKDVNSTASLSSRQASSTDTVNTVLVTGIVPSTGTTSYTFSGGVQNLPRLLEDWNGGTLWLNTSLVNLYASQTATGRFVNPGIYYTPPTRRFSYDLNFAPSNAFPPPGIPCFWLGPATVRLEPTNVTAFAGDTVKFTAWPDQPTVIYEWYFNGTRFAAGSGSWMNPCWAYARLTQSGNLSVVFTDSRGVTGTAAATVTVFPREPVIQIQPTNQVLLSGSNTSLSVSATGVPPLTYQWYFNGINPLAEATNATLFLGSLQATNAGEYSVLITNSDGSILSSNATVSVFDTPAASLGMPTPGSDSNIQFLISGVPGFNYAVQVSTNLVDWDWRITNASPFLFQDLDSTNAPQRFYRTIYLP
ncbi:MAG: immunoglobulin domain-containing protein [Verrucomicrobiota bacterium]